jgi:hypothetical protein
MMIPVDTPAQPDAVIADTEPDSGGGDTDTTEEPSDDEISDAGSPSDIIADAEPADEQQEEQREEDEVRTRARCLRDSHRAARLCCARLCCDRLSPSLTCSLPVPPVQSAPDSTSTPVNLPDTGASPSDETSSSDDTPAATVPAEGPPKAISGYLVFHQAIQKSSPEMFEGMAMTDKSKEVGKQWKLLDEKSKAPYEQEAQERKAKRQEWEQGPDGIQWKIQDKQAKDEKKKAKQKKNDDKMEKLTKMSAEDEWIKNTTKEQKDEMQKAAGTDEKIKPGEVKKALKQRWAEMDPAERQTLEKAKSEQIAAYRKKHPTSSSRSELAEPAAAAASGPSSQPQQQQQQMMMMMSNSSSSMQGLKHFYAAIEQAGKDYPKEVQQAALIGHVTKHITGPDGREITAQLKTPMMMMTPDLFSSNTASSEQQMQMQLEPAPDIAGGGDFMNFMANTDDGDSSPTSSPDASPQSSPAAIVDEKPRSAAAAAAAAPSKVPTIQKKKSGLHGGGGGGGGGLHGKKGGGLHGGGLKRKGGGLHGGDKRVKIEN